MNKLTVKRRPRAPVTLEQGGGEVVDRAHRAGSSFSFHFASLEVSTHGGKAKVKSRRGSFQDGRLRAESFEGDVDRGVYDEWVRQAQRAVADQASLVMKSLAWFLPFSRKPPGDRD